jgi:hypothetical protein
MHILNSAPGLLLPDSCSLTHRLGSRDARE